MNGPFWRRVLSTSFLSLFLLTGLSPRSQAYSVLTHEEIVDLLWADAIKPMLARKYPGSTDAQLREAHSYAYGGCLIQDMGYYPFGNEFYSDLVHLVRSGDFVRALLTDARDRNEYAFALGALAHYASDVVGHPSVNIAVARAFPRLRAKYGDQVTYAEDPKAHLKTEFGFDVAQVAKQRYTSDAYRDFVGFQVSQPLLERAFQETYGLELKDVLLNVALNIGSFRHSISQVIPEMTRVALAMRKKELIHDNPTFNKRQFLFNLSRTDYERRWGKDYQKPGFGARMLGFFFHLIPKVGPFKAMGFVTPTPETENLYFKSVNETVEAYRSDLLHLEDHNLSLPNRDFDTGHPTKPGEYTTSDHAYAKLVDKLAAKKFAHVSSALRENILQFYDQAADQTIRDKKMRRERDNALKEVEKLRSIVANQP